MRKAENNLKKELRKDKMNKNKSKQKVMPDTIGVLFVDQTVGGWLAKKLQEIEDRISRSTGYRIRIVELSGSKLCHLLANTNPWADQDCGRDDCVPCGQGGEQQVQCKRRNILYESECVLCNPEEGKMEKEKDLAGKQGVYVGESSRSLHERALEH